MMILSGGFALPDWLDGAEDGLHAAGPSTRAAIVRRTRKSDRRILPLPSTVRAHHDSERERVSMALLLTQQYVGQKPDEEGGDATRRYPAPAPVLPRDSR